MIISVDVQSRDVEANDGQSHGAGKLLFVCVTVATILRNKAPHLLLFYHRA